MTDRAFREGFRWLADHGLAFDLQTPWWHLHKAAGLAAISPDTPIILNHSGLPADRSDAGIAGWRAAIGAFAALPQTFVKISGLGRPGQTWSAADNAPIIRTCIDLFGPDRAMFASNFPVDRLCADFDAIYAGFDCVTRDRSGPERDALFHRTAARVYRIQPTGG